MEVDVLPCEVQVRDGGAGWQECGHHVLAILDDAVSASFVRTRVITVGEGSGGLDAFNIFF